MRQREAEGPRNAKKKSLSSNQERSPQDHCQVPLALASKLSFSHSLQGPRSKRGIYQDNFSSLNTCQLATL